MKANIRPALKAEIRTAAKAAQTALNAWTEAKATYETSYNTETEQKALRSMRVWDKMLSEAEGKLTAFTMVFGPSAVADVILEDESITLVPSCVVTTKQAR